MIATAKDDYYVIVYKILAYLYQCLKKGVPADGRNIESTNQYFQINPSYWRYILFHLQKSGLIEGLSFLPIDGEDIPLPVQLDSCRITPAGIEYLLDNSLMAKVRRLVTERTPCKCP